MSRNTRVASVIQAWPEGSLVPLEEIAHWSGRLSDEEIGQAMRELVEQEALDYAREFAGDDDTLALLLMARAKVTVRKEGL